MNLDVLTMLIMISITNLVMAGFIMIVGYNRGLASLNRLSLALLVNAPIYIVYYLQQSLPKAIFVHSCNTIAAIEIALLLYAIAGLRGVSLPRITYLLPIALAILTSVVLFDNDALCVAIECTIYVIQESRIILHFMMSKEMGSGRYLMFITTLLMMAMFAYRAIALVAGWSASTVVNADSDMNAITFLIIFMTVVLFSFGFMLAAFEQERLKMQKLHQQQTLRLERELHDGLGGHLAALSAMIGDGIENRQIFSETIDQALLDMRMIMDGIGDECRDVGMTLGLLRYRLQARLKTLGIDSTWDMDQLPVGCMLAEGGGLHLIRIVQEALTNVARHSGADHVGVRASVDRREPDHALLIEISDNGRGWDEVPDFGNGLNNMQKRAGMLGGILLISSRFGAGTRLTLTSPVTVETAP